MEKKTVIEVANLSARFGERQVLNEVTFHAYENEVTVLLGGSGSGKTTILKHLIGLYPVVSGSVRVLDFLLESASEAQKQSLFMQMGVLYQNGALLNSLSVAENVSLPLVQHFNLPPAVADRLAYMKLELLNLGDAFHLFPSQLSGGMRKRAALARSIALDPPLLFCDEPGAGLDPVSLAQLDALILKMKNQLGMTVILVTHEVSSIRRLADRIIFLDEGTVVFQGSLDDALSSDLASVRNFFKQAHGKEE